MKKSGAGPATSHMIASFRIVAYPRIPLHFAIFISKTRIEKIEKNPRISRINVFCLRVATRIVQKTDGTW